MHRIFRGGPAWQSGTYLDLPVTYPEMLKKYAGPRSRVNGNKYSFAGLGTSIMVDPATLTSFSDPGVDNPMGTPIPPDKYIDGVPTFSVEAPGFENVDFSVIPSLSSLGPGVVAPDQASAMNTGTNWWVLLAIAAGLYIATRGK